MSNEAQDWLNELTQQIENEEEYLKTLCPYRQTDHYKTTRATSPHDNIFIGGAVDGKKCPWVDISRESVEVPITVTPHAVKGPDSYGKVSVQRYYRRTVQVGSRDIVFWVHADLLFRGEDYTLDRILEWLSSNGLS